MSEASIVRRASYGPNSPAVGARGASTRTRITEVSLDLFGRLGYLNTSVDAIAKGAGVSRATLYQYFQGKDEIFVELLNECGSALFRVARRIGPLGPDEVGFDNLNWWLGEWSWVFDKYSTIFIQWTAVGSSDTKVRPLITSFERSYNHRVAERLAASGVRGLDPEVAAMTMTTLVHSINLFAHTNRAYGRSAKAAVDTLSVFLQLVLFPDTPPSVLSSLHLHASADPAANVDAIVVPPAPDVRGLSVSERSAGLIKRSVATLIALAEAGAAEFRARGYRGASVDDVVEAADVARGTFYNYFIDKQDFLAALAAEHYDTVRGFAERIAEVDPLADQPALRDWLAAYVEFYQRHSWCIDAWTDGTTDDPRIVAIGERGQVLMDLGVAKMLTRRSGPYQFDPIVSALIVRALVTRLPQAALDLPEHIDDDEFVDLLLSCITRGFFGSAS